MTNDMRTAQYAPVGPTKRQSGVVLVVALVALVTMTLAALGLIRSMDTGLTIAGNAAFKEATTAASDVSVDAATAWLQANSAAAATLHASAAAGYYASWMLGCDLTGNRTPANKSDDVDWAGSGGSSCGAKGVPATGMPSGYSASYIVTRMCACDGAPGALCPNGSYNVCAGARANRGFHDTADYVNRGLAAEEVSRVATGSPYYRIVTRVEGPRNTTSFVETVVTME